MAEALFEASWASYEGGDHEAALDGLDQLAARYPNSAYSAEAAVLRGYVHLGRCEFGAAEKELVAFEEQFGTVLREIDATLASASRREAVYRDLVARADSVARIRAEGRTDTPDPDGVLLALVERRSHVLPAALAHPRARRGARQHRQRAERVQRARAARDGCGRATPSGPLGGRAQREALRGDRRGATGGDALERDLRTLEREKRPKRSSRPCAAHARSSIRA